MLLSHSFCLITVCLTAFVRTSGLFLSPDIPKVTGVSSSNNISYADFLSSSINDTKSVIPNQDNTADCPNLVAARLPRQDGKIPLSAQLKDLTSKLTDFRCTYPLILTANVPSSKAKDTNIKEKCTFDFLYIFEQRPGDTNTQLLPNAINFRHNLGKYCGYVPPTMLHSTIPGSRVYFYFRSDSSKSAKGFSLLYKIFPENQVTLSKIPGLDDDLDHLFPTSREEEFLKVFSCIVFIFIFSTVVIGTLYKCWQSTSEQLAAEGRAQHSCCCGAIQLDVIAGERATSQSLARRGPSPRLPTPPPDYGDIVKTDEDWNKVIQQLGEASVIALHQRREAEELQVTYDLNRSPSPRLPSTTNAASSNQQNAHRTTRLLGSNPAESAA